MTFLKKLGVAGLLEWLVPLYIFLLPWQARFIIAPFSVDLPRYGDLSVYVTDWLFLVLVLLWFFYLRAERNKPHPEWRRLRPVILTVLALFAYATISLLWTPNAFVGREFLFRLAQAVLLAMMVAGGAVKTKQVLVAVSLSGALQGLFAVMQFFSQSVFASTILGMSAQAPQDLGVSVIEYVDERWLRAYGTLPHPNMLGAFCGVAMLCAAFLFWRGYRQNQGRLVLYGWVTFLCSYFGFLFAFSRSAWLATAVATIGFGIAELVVLDKASRRVFLIVFSKLVGVALLLLLFFTALFGPLWWSRSSGDGQLAQQSVNERAMLQQQAVTLAKQHPWVGSGIGSYVPSLMKQYPDRPMYFYQPVHRVVSILRVELGYVGLLLVATVFIALAYVLTKQRFYFGLALLGFFLVASFFDHFWYSLPFGMGFVAVLCSLSLSRHEDA